MINGEMAEAQRGFATLDDVDEETIQRFIEWAYKGYYTAGTFRQALDQAPEQSLPEQEEVKGSQKTFGGFSLDETVYGEDGIEDSFSWAQMRTPANVQDDLQERGYYSRRKFGKKVRGGFDRAAEPIEKVEHQATKNRRELKESFLKYEYKVRRNTINLPPTRGNLGPSEDYTDVFLSHARLYVFAEMYDIQVLKTLALEELHSTLANYTLYQSRTGDVIALLRYIYANTSSEEGDSDSQILRKVLRHYMGCEIGVLMKDPRFKDLMFEDGGDLLGDFMKLVALWIE